MPFAIVGAAALIASACACGGSGAAPLLGPAAVLIFAPHPDDDVICTAGVIEHALARGQSVRVVFATNGDGYPQAAAALFNKPMPALTQADYQQLAATRQREAIAAESLLGLSSSNLVFLGYPDGVLGWVYADVSSAPIRSPATGLASTYGPLKADYHSLAHGRPAPYTRTAAVADVAEIIRASRPQQVYVTDGADQHPDHRATFALVHDAIAAAGFKGELRTFVVHSGRSQEWPWPQGPTPTSPFEQHAVDGVTYPVGVPWPPAIRMPLTTAESALKLKALSAHSSQWALPVDREYLESFVKSEEIFWTGR